MDTVDPLIRTSDTHNLISAYRLRLVFPKYNVVRVWKKPLPVEPTPRFNYVDSKICWRFWSKMPCVQSKEHGLYLWASQRTTKNRCFDSNWKAITRDANRLVHNTPSPSNCLRSFSCWYLIPPPLRYMVSLTVTFTHTFSLQASGQCLSTYIYLVTIKNPSAWVNVLTDLSYVPAHVRHHFQQCVLIWNIILSIT